MFKTMDRVIGGEEVTILYRGVPLVLTSKQTVPSKLDRAVRRNALAVDPDVLLQPDTELLNALEQKWDQEPD